MQTILLWRYAISVILLFLCFGSCTEAAATDPFADFDPSHFSAYVKKVQTSNDPATIALRQQIADGPNALKREKAAALKSGFLLEPVKRAMLPDNENGAIACEQFMELRKIKPFILPNYAANGMSTRFHYTTEQIEEVSERFAARPDFLTLLHQVADRPSFAIKNLSGGCPGSADLRQVARYMMTESYVLAAQGKYSKAIVSQSRVYRLADHMSSTNNLLMYLTASAIDKAGSDGMASILMLSGSDPGVCASVRQAIIANRPNYAYKNIVVTDVADALAHLQRLRHDCPGAWNAKAIDALTAEYLRRSRLALMSKTPSAIIRGTIGAPFEAKESAPDIFHALRFLGPIDDNNSIFANYASASASVVIAASDVISVRTKTGTFPIALPHFVRDPLSKTGLHYRRKGTSGFVIYSVGVRGNFDGNTDESKYLYRSPIFRYPVSGRTTVPENKL